MLRALVAARFPLLLTRDRSLASASCAVRHQRTGVVAKEARVALRQKPPSARITDVCARVRRSRPDLDLTRRIRHALALARAPVRSTVLVDPTLLEDAVAALAAVAVVIAAVAVCDAIATKV